MGMRGTVGRWLPAILAVLTLGLRPAYPKGLTVHEWGTFTTLSTSWGEPLEGLYVDASRLPDFVHGLPFFNHGSSGWPDPSRLKGVTVKMETPVLYFYSDAEVDVTAKVGFQGGTISQWFPQRHEGEANPAGPVVDLGAEPYQGSIFWKAKVLSLSASAGISPSFPASEHAEWIAPRATAANWVKGEDGMVEKFLFYRGLGNFPSSVTLSFLEDGRLKVKNVGPDPIPFLLVYDRALQEGIGGAAAIWGEGPWAAGEERILPKPAPGDYTVGVQAMENLHAAMVSAGLFADEARALLNTWYNGYFIEAGIKAFWIMPRNQVDRILPLELTPRPEALERVIIGRSEILPPALEAKLLAEGGNLPTWSKDKYHLAYRDFLLKWQARQSATAIRLTRPRGNDRTWSRVLPWQGPLSSPAIHWRGSRGAAGAAGGPIWVDFTGRTFAR
jgi:hypothetical protein